MATTKNIDNYFDIVSAGAMGTFTYPAHMAMFQGFFPTIGGKLSGSQGFVVSRPIYNRFSQSVYKWFYRSDRYCLTELTGSGSIPLVLRDKKYRTVAIGGVGWFNKRTPMRLGFEEFIYETNGEKAINEFINQITREPYYGLLNFGTTHRPYRVPEMPRKLKRVRSPRSGNDYNSQYSYKLRDKQVACMTYTDKILVKLFEWLKSTKLRTVVCFCSDHGDCMGEDGCYGHGFMHPNIMTVPLGWTVFMPSGESYPITRDNLDKCGFKSVKA